MDDVRADYFPGRVLPDVGDLDLSVVVEVALRVVGALDPGEEAGYVTRRIRAYRVSEVPGAGLNLLVLDPLGIGLREIGVPGLKMRAY
ncbi:hypothetical protein J5J86_22310 [Aquabacter sp. L1I39]|uniref:hypothetical protein n=1 Tax=Aquabacter sp. L1I39 TaxID=2820278 RepID=UPI001AD9DE9B|nr:hypothetical protein [Aquabacter sp. L1I39]QTL03434.1 hypothetical protein J5J86_22310 [Aquabacter sp. L1I39]